MKYRIFTNLIIEFSSCKCKRKDERKIDAWVTDTRYGCDTYTLTGRLDYVVVNETENCHKHRYVRFVR